MLGIAREVLHELIGWDGEISINTINRGPENAASIYSRSRGKAYRAAVGRASSYSLGYFSLFLRLGADEGLADESAQQIFERLAGSLFDFGGRRGFVSAVYDAPIWLGADKMRIHEYSIDFDLYLEKK